VVYFDDILVYSQSEEEHLVNLTQVMEVLEKKKLYGNLKKCSFFTQEVTSLGYIVTAQGTKVDERKIEAIQLWPTPSSIDDVRGFHGLAFFNRRFIRNFSTITAPMTEALKQSSFKWNPKAQQTIEEIKKNLTQALVLALLILKRSLKWSVMHPELVLVGFSLKKAAPLPTLVRTFMTTRESAPLQ